MNRRHLIKTLALSPLLLNRSFCSFALRNGVAQTPTPSNVFILLHGLFFLEYQGGKLVVTAPEVADHDYQMGTPDNDGKDLQPLPSTPQDFSDPAMGLTGASNATQFPPELLQFSKKDTGVGNLTGPFRFRCTLPSPLQIVPLRNGPRSDLHCTPGNVLSSINKHQGARIGIVTCLVYTGSVAKIHPTSTDRCHFYAEPDFEPNLEHTNHALSEARLLFANGKNFDLQLDTSVLTQNLPLVPAVPPSRDDPRVSLSGAFEEDPLFAIRSLGATPQAVTPRAKRVAQPLSQNPESVNVANCGQYGVTSP